MLKICGDCKDADVAREIRDYVDDPVMLDEKRTGDFDAQSKSSEDATVAYMRCVGKCGRPSEAEHMYFSHENRASIF